MKNCKVDNCDKKSHAKDYCCTHYNNLKRRGDPEKDAPVKWHGLKGTPEYSVWCSIKERCNNKNNSAFKHYGARGIKVCERWLGRDGFTNFYKDMGKRPKDYSIDRIDVNGDYTPDNCRWADKYTQAQNKRVSQANKSGYTGIYFRKDSKRWSVTIRAFDTKFYLGCYDSFGEALKVRLEGERKYFGAL